MRQADFKTVQQCIEAGEEGDMAKSDPFKAYVETRWLARGPVLVAIKDNWVSLGAYFSSIDLKQVPQEKRIDLRKMVDILRDQYLLILLIFLVPIIQELEKLNTMFQVLIWK